MRAILALLVPLGLCSLLLAQDPASDTPEDIARKQQEVGRRLKAIEETMRRVKEILARSDPEKAARLELALRRSRVEDRNLDRIQRIEDFLRSEYFQQAMAEQKELARALERLLDILLDRDTERKELEEKVQRMEQARELLERVIAEERGHFHETEKFADPEKALERAAAAKAKLDDLIRRQQELIESTVRETEGSDLAEWKRQLAELLAAQLAA
ncbi:MAG: hypothetical protein ACREID_03940, partial [Planctomycetota bacterium]